MALLWDPPQKLPRGSLSLGRADRPPCNAWHSSFHLDGNHSSFHPDGNSHSFHPGHLTSGSGQRFTVSGCLRAAILSGRHPTLSGCLTAAILFGQRSTFSGYSHPAPAVGWERRTFQLPQADMSGSFDNAYPDNICGQRFRFPE